MEKKRTESVGFYGLSKILRIMRITAFLLLVFVAQTWAINSYSQQTRLTINLEHVKVMDVLNEIEINSDFYFLFNKGMVDTERKVSIDVDNQKIGEVLSYLFEGTNVNYVIKERQVVLTTKRMENGVVLQQQKITGNVIDSSGQPLPGVSIIIKGSTTGTVTDFDGNYILEDVPGDAILVFSFVGMKTQEVAVSGKGTINVTLANDAIGIEEVVAIGYGTQKKVNLTGAIGIAKGEVLENRPILNALEGLQGVVAGLNITNPSGQPGSNPKINIRGATSIGGGAPLVLVDGAQMHINNINPDDIESISVLKDAASSAIYGARAAYGVILVTTKSGKRNSKTKVTYNGSFFAASPTILPEKSDSYKLATYTNLMRSSVNAAPYYDETVYGLMKETVNGSGIDWTQKENGSYYWHANTDYADLVFSGSAPGQNHSLSISGGTEKTGFHFSAGYLDYDGVVKLGGDNYKRYNATLKVDTDVTDWLTARFQVNLRKNTSDVHNLPPGHGQSIFHTVWRAWPTLAPYLEKDGVEYPTFTRLNPVATLKQGGRNVNDGFLLNSKAGIDMKFGDFKVFSNFTYNPTVSQVIRNNRAIESIYPWVPGGGDVRVDGGPSYIQKVNSFNSYYAFDAYGQYDKLIGSKHQVKVMAGYNQEWMILSNVSAYNTDLISDDILSLSNSNGDPIVGDVYNQWALRSGFLRINYSYADKYLVEINGRYDGSSRFRKEDRFGFFPSISTGWRISEESFMNDIEEIDNLKLRASYGSLGNQSSGALYPVSTYGTIPQVGVILNGNRPLGIQPGNPLGDARTWETVSTIDLGVDATLFQGLNITVDVYQRTTEDMLVSGNALPSIYGAAAPQINAADLEVRGWDASVAWNSKIGNDFKYNLGLTIADWQGEITKFENPTKSLGKPYYVGQTIGEIWGFETVGLFQSMEEIEAAADHSTLGGGNLIAPGDVHYADLDGSMEIDGGEGTVDDSGDRRIIGNRTPRYSYSLTGGAEWKGFDMNVFFQGVAKRDFWLDGPIMFGGEGGPGNVIVTDYLYENVWSDGTGVWSDGSGAIPENRDAYYFRPSEGAVINRNTRAQTRYMQDASYLRLKNITLGYTLPKSLVQRVGISNCRFYISGENLLTFTKLNENFDPEVMVPNEGSQGMASSGSMATTQGGKSYPLSKRLSIGINLAF